MPDIDPEGFVSGGPGCVCGPLYSYAGHVEPGQYAPDCPIHGEPMPSFHPPCAPAPHENPPETLPVEAVEAAARAWVAASPVQTTGIEGMAPHNVDRLRLRMAIALAAAMPHIETTIRAQVRDELRAEARKMRERQSHIGPFIDGVQVAANWAVSGGEK